jgi:NADH-quinone oxidoreductase subunit I
MAKLTDVIGSAAAVAKGMGITFKEMLQPTITEDYPDGPARLEERYRGAHVLQRDENGL